jgi:hypothetical protein
MLLPLLRLFSCSCSCLCSFFFFPFLFPFLLSVDTLSSRNVFLPASIGTCQPLHLAADRGSKQAGARTGTRTEVGVHPRRGVRDNGYRWAVTHPSTPWRRADRSRGRGYLFSMCVSACVRTYRHYGMMGRSMMGRGKGRSGRSMCGMYALCNICTYRLT